MKEKINKPKAARKQSSAGFLPAAVRGDVTKIRQLLDDGVLVNRANNRGETALMHATLRGHLQCMQLLIDRGADVNAIAKGADGRSAVAYACMRSEVETLKLLLDRGGDVNARGDEEMTPLMYACRFCKPACVALLLERGANPTLTDHLGDTALAYCKTEEIRKMIEDLTPDYVLK